MLNFFTNALYLPPMIDSFCCYATKTNFAYPLGIKMSSTIGSKSWLIFNLSNYTLRNKRKHNQFLDLDNYFPIVLQAHFL